MTTLATQLIRPKEETDRSTDASRVPWVLFLLLNATLFMRPAEIIPQLVGWPIYEVLILSCLVLSFPSLLSKLHLRSLAANPITLCVLGMLPAIVLSHLMRGETWYARTLGTEFIKIILYYLLLVTLVNSPRRLWYFLSSLVIYALVLNAVAMLSYHRIVDLTTVRPLRESQPQIDPTTGEHVTVLRLQAAGIYANPNDLSRLGVVGITICLFAIGWKASGWRRVLWLVPLAVFAYAVHLTYSRGGLLAMLAGITVLFHARYGMKKGIVFAAIVLAPALVLAAGRQTDISTSDGTGQLRIKLWSNGLVAMRASPIFGIGANRYFSVAGNHAHNSFLEVFVETGVIGGTLFTSAFALAAAGMYRLKSREMEVDDPELWRLRAYVLSLVVSTIVGQLSSSREYSEPTYMILGLATAFMGLAAQHTPGSTIRLSPKVALRLMGFSAMTLLIFKLYAEFNARFGR